MTTFEAFYARIDRACALRNDATSCLWNGRPVPATVREGLAEVLAWLEALPRREDAVLLRLGDTAVAADLSYETSELERDLLFLEGGAEAVLERIAADHDDFWEHVARLVDGWEHVRFNNLVSDRDGTINNYCGRYRSSIQSIYNAMFIAEFVDARVDRATIVTSGPLRDPGVVSISVLPAGLVNFAASKARECLDTRGRLIRMPIDPAHQGVLDTFNERLVERVADPRFAKFGLLGSGIQFKFGETTIARQDNVGSIDAAESLGWRGEIEGLVRAVDPEGRTLSIIDMALDVEVVLNATAEVEFSKADGLRFLDGELGLGLAYGTTLVCGDTQADLHLFSACVDAGADVRAVLVSTDEALAHAAREISPRLAVVPAVDMLIAAFHRAAGSRGGAARRLVARARRIRSEPHGQTDEFCAVGALLAHPG